MCERERARARARESECVRERDVPGLVCFVIIDPDMTFGGGCRGVCVCERESDPSTRLFRKKIDPDMKMVDAEVCVRYRERNREVEGDRDISHYSFYPPQSTQV